MSSSRKWANIISFVASWIYFFTIIFQVPLFRVPCRSGICKSPLEVTSCQLIASEISHPFVVKALLYPGAVATAIFNNKTIPSYNELLKIYNLTNVKKASAITDLLRFEVLVGSYFSVAGAFLGVSKRGRMSLFGTVVIMMGLIREATFRNINPMKAIHIHPTLSMAIVFAFLSVKKDVRKIIRSCKPRSKAKYI